MKVLKDSDVEIVRARNGGRDLIISDAGVAPILTEFELSSATTLQDWARINQAVRSWWAAFNATGQAA